VTEDGQNPKRGRQDMTTDTKTREEVTLAPVVAALHETYDALAAHVLATRNVALPPAVFVVQRDASAWGHITTRPAWQSDTEVIDEDYAYAPYAVSMGLGMTKRTYYFHEIMVSGENLARGAREVFGTVAHETAHAYNMAVGHRDVDINGRHNRIFKIAAESLFGLTIGQHRPNHWAGWTKTTVSPECAERWATLIDLIDEAIRVASGRKDEDGNATGGGFGGFTLPPNETGRNKNQLRATCGCGSIIRTSAKVLLKGVVCVGCGEPFKVDGGR
jgi:hypothetical protein